MKSPMIAAVFGMFVLALGIGTLSLAQEAKSPTQFTLGILADHNVSFVLPSALIVDERGRASGVTLAITNHTKQQQGFAIDRLHVKEVVKPGETKVVKLSVTDLDGIGTDQSVFPYYNQLDKAHIGGLLYIKR
jgi:hypothetical protein